MKQLLLLLLIAASVVVSACTVAPQSTISSFEECVAAGNAVMESYPRQCAANGETFVEELENERKPCTREYMPVCGSVQVQCVTAPCDPINTTFPNRCEAENANAEILYEGECVEAVNPEGACLSFDGNWIEETQECEGMSQGMCVELGGEFNECASACRNDPDAEVCTLQCVLVCQFA
jgi:hypothetical protein